MNRGYLSKWIVSFAAALSLVACERGAGQTEVEPGGAFLQSGAGAPEALWEGGMGSAPAPHALEVQLPRGERAIFLELDARQAVGGTVRAGDDVDIQLTVDVYSVQPPDPIIADAAGASRPGGGWLATTILQNVRVLRTEPVAEKPGTWSLAVAATREEAQLLRVTQASGQLSLLLRHPKNDEISPVSRLSLKSGLMDLEVFNRERQKRQEAKPRPRTDSNAPVAWRLAPEMRAMALPVELPAAVTRHLEAGSWIDIDVTLPMTSRDRVVAKSTLDSKQDVVGSLAMSLLQNVRVLAASGGQNGQPTNVVVEVTEQEAKLLALGASYGELDIAMRPEGDHEFGSVRRKSMKQVLQDLEVINRARKTRVKRRVRRKLDSSIRVYRGSSRPSAGASKSNAEATSEKEARAPRIVPGPPQRSATVDFAAPDPPKEPAKTELASQTDALEQAAQNPIKSTKDEPRSTFALDVDTGSYTLARRYLQEDELPPAERVRVEEFVNYFDYDNPYPTDKPFAVTVEGAPSPFWRTKKHKIVRIGVQAKRENELTRRPINLTFLVDTSSSMRGGDRLGLVKRALIELTRNLGPEDTIAIVQYNDRVDQVLGRASADQKPGIVSAIKSMRAGGATDLEAGFRRAYKLARLGFEEGKENRVVLLSDGDPNVGAQTHRALLSAVEEESERGVTLSTVGFGRSNYGDGLMEQLADNGDGNSFYISDKDEAKRLFGERLLSTLVVVARDVKAQVEFDPAVVSSYRRIGYVNRTLSEDDWHDAAADAGEIGAGHRVTVLYEVELVDEAPKKPLGTVKVRYKLPDKSEAFEIEASLSDEVMQPSFAKASVDLRFAASVVGFAEILGESPLGRYLSLEAIAQTAKEVAGEDSDRLEFVELVERARQLRSARDAKVKLSGRTPE
ncbi:RcpC/CpaB family pilus assembly protein [Persicimonas caeni]|nr:von Willebrand factor type A domain-containing protein [Persicimonas caeni]